MSATFEDKSLEIAGAHSFLIVRLLSLVNHCFEGVLTFFKVHHIMEYFLIFALVKVSVSTTPTEREVKAKLG